jgi:hypothetical protein
VIFILERFFSPIEYKMETQTLGQLRAAASQLRIRGYRSMRKAELISALASHQSTTSDYLVGFDAWADEQLAKPAKQSTSKWNDWLTDHVPIPSGFNAWVDEQLAKLIKKVAANTFDWIGNNVSQPVKKVIDAGFYAFKNKISRIFNNVTKPKPTSEIRETASAIKGVTKQYTIDGQAGVDPQIFMNDVRSQVTDLLSRNRQIKANIVLTCEMERVDMKSGEVTTAEIPFATKAEVVLEATDVNELYTAAVDRILEKIWLISKCRDRTGDLNLL